MTFLNKKQFTGIIHCRIKEGNVDEAADQLEFLSEIQAANDSSTSKKSAELAYLQSLIHDRKNKDTAQSLEHLNSALSQHITSFKSHGASGYAFFDTLNAEFMLDLASEYLNHSYKLGHEGSAKPGSSLNRGVKVLETVTRFVPGLVPAQILLAKTKMAINDDDAAHTILQTVLRQGGGF